MQACSQYQHFGLQAKLVSVWLNSIYITLLCNRQSDPEPNRVADTANLFHIPTDACILHMQPNRKKARLTRIWIVLGA